MIKALIALLAVFALAVLVVALASGSSGSSSHHVEPMTVQCRLGHVPPRPHPLTPDAIRALCNHR